MIKVFEAHITPFTLDYLKNNLTDSLTLDNVNKKIHQQFGIVNFLENNNELINLKIAINDSVNITNEIDRAEYGDFQTNCTLANKVALYLQTKNIQPHVVIEPTCGKGNFIIASLHNFSAIKYIFGIEIYKPYVWETKFNIIDFYLNHHKEDKPDISINHCDVFEYDFKKIAKQFLEKEILIIGNPPWVTNSKLGSLNSLNLPKKTNFKNHSGLDAMTGKGNFDIAEYITMMMVESFQKHNGTLALLVKNSVIKNIVFDQLNKKYPISELEKHSIDSKKEFNVSVEASLFNCKLKSTISLDCTEYDFYNNLNSLSKFGWLGNKFVSNINTYNKTKKIDGECPFIWRQGLKHDCSSIMELDRVNGHYVNGLKEEVVLEEGLVYGILKSSDLKNTVINQTRKFTIVTQKKVGQETKFIKNDYPKTYQYLIDHQENFNARKSSIYSNKPSFSIFGIGDYSFKPYKVAISGLYKTFHFTLILPQNGKSVMLDDTCYLIGFDEIEFAVYSLILLNSDITKRFLQSITFSDAKRTFTKDALMRINLLELANIIDASYIENELSKLNEMYNLRLTLVLWNKFINSMKPLHFAQIEMFSNTENT